MLGVSWGAITVASIVAMGIGWVWYMPAVFGRTWMRLRGSAAQTNTSMSVSDLFVEFVSTFITVFALNILILAFGAFTVRGALQLALIVWLGFYVTALMSEVLWEKKPFGVFAINAAHRLLALSVAALVLALW